MDDIDLVDILSVLADPVRVRIVVGRADHAYHRSNTEEHGLDINKSMQSYDLKTVREAGIASTEVRGRFQCFQPRRARLGARFPGVLDKDLAAAAGRNRAARYLARSEPTGKS